MLGEVVAGSDSFFDLDFGLPQLELVNGRFVEADVASLPIVDTDELRNLVLDAAITGGNGTAVIEIPIIGSEAVDRGADELIAEAHRLTKNGIALRVLGSSRDDVFHSRRFAPGLFRRDNRRTHDLA